MIKTLGLKLIKCNLWGQQGATFTMGWKQPGEDPSPKGHPLSLLFIALLNTLTYKVMMDNFYKDLCSVHLQCSSSFVPCSFDSGMQCLGNYISCTQGAPLSWEYCQLLAIRHRHGQKKPTQKIVLDSDFIEKINNFLAQAGFLLMLVSYDIL